MKKFFRTIAGKITLFFSCAVTLSIAVVAIIGVCGLIGFDFYTNSEDSIFTSLANERLANIGRDYLSVTGVFDGKTPLIDTVNDEHNIIMKFFDVDGNVLIQSSGAADVSKWDSCVIYRQIKGGLNTWGYLQEDRIEYSVITNPPMNLTIYAGDNETVTVALFKLKEGLPEKDYFQTLKTWVSVAYKLRHWTYIVGALSFLAFAVLYVMLVSVAGHRPDTDKPVPGALNFIPFDVLLIVVAAVFWLAVAVVYNVIRNITSSISIPAIFCIGEAAIWAFLGFSMEVASRVKMKRLVKSTLLYRLFRLIAKGFRAIPMVWRSIIVWLLVMLLEFFLIYLVFRGFDVPALTVFFVVKFIELGVAIYLSSALRRLEKAGQELAHGNLEYKTDVAGMPGDFKRYGETLNSISDTMSDAVEQKLKSERMKTVLITNVSHDIKTPLTSIINYTGLINQEQCDNPKIAEYSDVLRRQSERLKRLIEDLVEASKASTGNLEVNLMPCDASVFVEQAGGEYEDKLAKANLQLVVKQPQDEIRIMADGRRMWRIFDNLMNNICKYALEGTRVFLSLEQVGNDAVFTFKNTSRAPLDMSEDELMERFTRGDSSRNTEGNGLGLSIAKSMAELQKGSLHLEIDGDFFKAVLTFPVITE